MPTLLPIGGTFFASLNASAALSRIPKVAMFQQYKPFELVSVTITVIILPCQLKMEIPM